MQWYEAVRSTNCEILCAAIDLRLSPSGVRLKLRTGRGCCLRRNNPQVRVLPIAPLPLQYRQTHEGYATDLAPKAWNHASRQGGQQSPPASAQSRRFRPKKGYSRSMRNGSPCYPTHRQKAEDATSAAPIRAFRCDRKTSRFDVVWLCIVEQCGR